MARVDVYVVRVRWRSCVAVAVSVEGEQESTLSEWHGWPLSIRLVQRWRYTSPAVL